MTVQHSCRGGVWRVDEHIYRCAGCNGPVVPVAASFVPSEGHGRLLCSLCGATILACPNDPGVDVGGLIVEIGDFLAGVPAWVTALRGVPYWYQGSFPFVVTIADVAYWSPRLVDLWRRRGSGYWSPP